MTDRVHPSTKSNAAPPTTTTPTPTPAPTTAAPPAAKTQGLYNPTRQPYRPGPTTPRNRYKHRQFSCRRCACLACFWSFLILIAVLLLAAIAAAAAYALYHPHRPTFSISALKISSFSLTTTPADDSTRLTARINVTLSARNPNKKITFVYDPMSVTVLSSNSVNLSNGTAANFTSGPDSVAVIHAAMGVNSQVLDADSVNSLKSDLKENRGVPMEIVADTMVGVKMEKLKMKKIGIRVKCEGIRGVVPKKGKKVIPAAANTSGAKCKVDLRIKIFKWTF